MDKPLYHKLMDNWVNLDLWDNADDITEEELLEMEEELDADIEILELELNNKRNELDTVRELLEQLGQDEEE